MSNDKESEFSRDIDGRTQSSQKSPVIWVEHLRPIVFQTVDDPSFQLGALHSIDWTPSLDFLSHLLKLTCLVTGFDESKFTVTSLLRYQDGRSLAKPGVGIFANDDAEIGDEILHSLEVAAAFFCHSVLVGQEVIGQEKLFPTETPDDTQEALRDLIDDFLSNFGGKRVGEARLLKTRSCELLVVGSYLTAKDQPLPEPATWYATGEIDGIRGVQRTLYIKVSERKTISIFFDEQEFRERLRHQIMDKQIYEFVIETAWIASGKSIDSLIMYRRCDGVGDSALI
jgi:hypothetical protein